MPKSSDKKKGAQKKRKASRTSCGNTAGNGDEGNITPKRRKLLKKPDYKNEIAKSKQLASKLRNPTSRSSNSSKKTEPRLCGNGMPMPTLADLERMFEDSDSDEEPTSTAKVKKVSERPKTPENPIPAIENKLVSPKTIKNIASKLMDMISNNEILPIIDDGPPPPIVPQKKPKKSDIPYIVGCKERPQVPWQPKTSFCKGDEDYGVDKNAAGSDDEENSCPKKRRRGTKVNLSKSIFNAQSDEIAERLKNTEYLEGQLNSSPESTNTEPYEYSENSNYMTNHFEPLASTSTDRVTIDINDRLFNESFNSALSNNTQDHLEVIEINNTKCSKDNEDSSIQNNQQDSADDDSCIVIGTEIKNESLNINENSVDCCVIIDSDSEGKNENRSIETIIEDDLPNYDISTIDLTDNNDIDMGEVIDIDSIIAENEATISKYRVKKVLDTVTLVEPSNSRNAEEHTVSDRNTNPSNNSETNLQQNRTIPESIPVTLEDAGNNADRIANVVADFFAQSEIERNNPDNIVDLTGSPGTLVNKITSWISKIQSFVNGRQTSQDEGNCLLRFLNHRASNSGENNDPSHLQSGQIRISQVQDNQSLNTNITTMPSIAKRNYQQPNSVPSAKIVSNIVPSAGSAADNTGANRSIPQQMPSHQLLGDCPICMDSLLNNQIASTICGHVFCMKCIKAAVKANGKKCPNCRMKFKGVGYHQLFL